MKLNRQDFDWVASEGLISRDQAASLWEALEARAQGRAAFDLVHILYALGAALVVAAMTWFMAEAWDRFGGGAMVLTATAYGVVFTCIGRRLRRQPLMATPGGVLYVLAVAMVPVAIWGLQMYTGVWVPEDEPAGEWFHLEPKRCRLIMEAATILVGALVLKGTRFPFALTPIVAAGWAMALDLTLSATGQAELSSVEQCWVALGYGLVVLVISYAIDRRTPEDYAFWGYLLGMLAFWGGLTSMESDSELSKLGYCLINVGLMLLSMLFARRVFVVFGALGVFVYLADLAERLFKDSLLFSIALVALGVVVIYLGTQYQRRREAVEAAVRGVLPAGVRRLLPTEWVSL